MKPFVRLIAVALGAAAFSTAVVAATTYVVPQTKALDSRGGPAYVDDAALKAAIPELAGAGERSQTCANDIIFPPHVWFSFGPTVTGAHTGRVANVSCAFESQQSMRDGTGDLTCDQVRFQAVGFGDDSSHFFSADANVEPAEARELFNALFGGQLCFTNAVKDKPPDIASLRSISISRERGTLVVRWGDCGCTSTLRVKHHAGDHDRAFIVTNFNWMCI
jgi:hypothetical protein